MPKKFYLTTPIYYVNAKPHIGHAYTTIAADIIARYQRMIGKDVFFLTGTDEHGSKIATAASEQKKTPLEFCDEISATFKLAWDTLNISNSDFIRTTEPRHETGVLKFIKKLKDAGAIYEKKYAGLYCEGCEKFVTEKDIVDDRCIYHPNKKLQSISEKNYFFKLSNYLEKIKTAIEDGDIKILPANGKSEVLGLFKQGLTDFSISREKVKWGIKFPYGENQVTYVWIDALSNYITALGYGSDEKKYKDFWSAETLHLLGRDILKFHAIYWPAMLLAIGEPLPKTLFVHGFFTINGQKMSKSLNNVIDPLEMVKKYGVDATRYLIISQFPFGQDGNVDAARFDEKYNADLANKLGNLVSRVIKLKVKSEELKVTIKSSKVKKIIEANWKNYISAFEDFQIDKGLNEIERMVTWLNGYIDAEKPWKLQKENPEKFMLVMLELLEALRHLGWMLIPFMPEIAQKILKTLGVWENEKTQKFFEISKWKNAAGIKITKSEILFPRI